MTSIENNPLVTVYNEVESVLKDNITDINTTRSSKSTAKEKQWIFPEVPLFLHGTHR